MPLSETLREVATSYEPERANLEEESVRRERPVEVAVHKLERQQPRIDAGMESTFAPDRISCAKGRQNNPGDRSILADAPLAQIPILVRVLFPLARKCSQQQTRQEGDNWISLER